MTGKLVEQHLIQEAVVSVVPGQLPEYLEQRNHHHWFLFHEEPLQVLSQETNQIMTSETSK